MASVLTFPVRRESLPGGEQLIVRPVGVDDGEALEALYESLDADDRYRRFFSAYHPDRAFFERLTTVAQRGGVGLVAVVVHADGREELVGDASFTRLPDGNGELAITVAEPWRGWIGAYLLDGLITAASAAGVGNLEAEILASNRQMLALVRARGAVQLDSQDWSIVRVRIGTHGSVPTWGATHDRPRIVLEGSGGPWRREDVRGADVEVVSCRGPAGDRRTPCPALLGFPCPLAAGADAIVVREASVGPSCAELLAAHGELHPGVAVFVDTGDAAEDVVGRVLAHIGARRDERP